MAPFGLASVPQQFQPVIGPNELFPIPSVTSVEFSSATQFFEVDLSHIYPNLTSLSSSFFMSGANQYLQPLPRSLTDLSLAAYLNYFDGDYEGDADFKASKDSLNSLPLTKLHLGLYDVKEDPLPIIFKVVTQPLLELDLSLYNYVSTLSAQFLPKTLRALKIGKQISFDSWVLEAICGLTELRTLSLTCSRVSFKSGKDLLELKQLKKLNRLTLKVKGEDLPSDFSLVALLEVVPSLCSISLYPYQGREHEPELRELFPRLEEVDFGRY